jgi:hypothetical protein
MSDDVTEGQEGLNDRDGMLLALVEMAIELSLEVAITLQVGSALVTGQLIGRKAYLKAFHDQFVSGFPTDVQALIRKEMQPGAIEPSDEPNRHVDHIHIRNARLMDAAGSRIPIGLWRGRLAAISGFVLGELNVQ